MSRVAQLAAVSRFALLAAGGDAQAEDLNSALGQAYLGNPTLDAARAQLRGTDEGVPQALSGWRPTVQGQVSAGSEWSHDGSKAGPNNLVIDRNRQFYPRTYSLTLTQPLFDGFGTVSGTKAAENRVKAGRAQLLDTEQQVLFAAVQAYVSVVTNQSILDLNRNNVKVLQAQLQATNDRFQAGEVTKTDVSQAQASLQGALASQISAEGDLTASIAVYRQNIGQEPVQLSMPSVPPNLPLKQEDVVAMSQEAPLVVSAQFVEAATKDDIDTQFSDLLPSVSLQGSVSRADEQASTRDSTTDGTIFCV